MTVDYMSESRHTLHYCQPSLRCRRCRIRHYATPELFATYMEIRLLSLFHYYIAAISH